MDIDELVTNESKGSASPAGVRTSTTFHQKPMGQRQPRHQSGQSRRRSSSSSSSRTAALPPLAPKPPTSGGHVSLVRSPTIPEENTSTLHAAPPFGAGPPPPPPIPQHEYPSTGAGQFPIGNEPGAQSFDILNPDLDLSHFKTPPGSSGGATNYTDLSVSAPCSATEPRLTRARLADSTPFSPARTELRGRTAILSHSLLLRASRVRQAIRLSSSPARRPP